MQSAEQVRIARWPLKLLSAVTLVALLAAPACAPLCAGQNCRQADTSALAKANRGCHGIGSMPHEAPRAHAFRICGSTELPAVVLTTIFIRQATRVSRLSAPDGKFLAVAQEDSAPIALFSDCHSARPHGSPSSFAPVPPDVLRI